MRVHDGYAAILEAAREETEALVAVERGEGHAVVRMDDPERLNALSGPLTVQLLEALTAIEADQSVRAVVLTGADPGFSAGGDLRLMEEHAHPMVDDSPGGATEAWRWIRRQFGGVVRTIVKSDKPYVAAVNGAAAGVGLAFALACDLIVASDRARIVPAFGRIGLVPEVGNSWLVTRRLGYQRAFELFTEGGVLSGAEAAELGLVNEVVPHDDLMPAALRHVERLAELPPHVAPMTKTLLRQAADMTWDQAIAAEEFAEPMCFTTTGHREAVAELLGHATR
ncbi:MAG TPA: enoyl-CoA hydratase/isomerase family protein [Thermoleophilaceae bacterium]|jgi:2-(1,2-epoxy-1,2-dihydrophenyl)acetyl-CoA isomerase